VRIWLVLVWPQRDMYQILKTFNDTVSSASGLVCTIGLPSEEELRQNVVLIWPWRIEEEVRIRTPRPDRIPRPQSQNLIIHCVVFAPDAAVLGQIQEELYREPMLGNDDQLISVCSEPLAIEDLLGLFTAAKLVPRLCLSYMLRPAAA
jgi:hypothetical protein